MFLGAAVYCISNGDSRLVERGILGEMSHFYTE